MVDPVATGVTKPTLLSFPRFMRSPGILRLAPAVLVVAAASSAAFLVAHAPIARAACVPASSAPCPTPTPVNAFLSLDVTAGGPSTVINVSGGQFLPNEPLTLYWDQPNKVAGSATADANGSFNTRIKPFSGDAPGVHRVCASVPPNPCANFALDSATASPSPTASPSDSPLPTTSPEQTPSLTATPARITSTLSGFDIISRPPFVFLPIFGIGAILLSVAYWAFSVIRRPRRPSLLPAAAVVHRATRPDYTAGFGAAPASGVPAPQQSAWNEPMRTAPPADAAPSASAAPPPSASSPVTEEPVAEWGPPVEWGTGKAGWGFEEPPETDEAPEIPPPGD